MKLSEIKMYDRHKDTWPDGHTKSRFNADGSKKDGTSKSSNTVTHGLEVWKKAVQQKYPDLKLKFKMQGKAGEKQEIYAEVDGVDRCYGVFNVSTKRGEVLGESAL